MNMINSKKARKHIDGFAKLEDHLKRPVYFCEKDVVRAVEYAEAEARERAITAFYAACRENRGGDKCHNFIVVGHEAPDDRLYKKCEDVRGTHRCSANIGKFLAAFDNLKTDQP